MHAIGYSPEVLQEEFNHFLQYHAKHCHFGFFAFYAVFNDVTLIY